MKEPGQIDRRITEYLSAGGLFNPELMDHEKVRDLLIDCRDALAAVRADERERAARVCENMSGPIETYNPNYAHYLKCAAAIRNLGESAP